MSERRLSELDPRWWPGPEREASEARGVSFRCPVCTDGHRITVPWTAPSPFQNAALWTLIDAGRFDVLTVSPSIDCTRGGLCMFHGWLQHGMVRW